MTHYADGINLYKKETIRYTGKEKKSGYGGYSTTTAANSINKVSSENKIEKISVDENALYVPTTTYYLGSPSGKYLLAVKKNFEKVKLLIDLNVPEISHSIIISQETAQTFRKWIRDA